MNPSVDSRPSVEAVFSDYVAHLQEDQELRESIRDVLRDLEQVARECAAVLQKVHQPGGIQKISELSATSRDLLRTRAAPELQKLASLLPEGQYYKFHPMFNFSLQRLAFSASFCHYLECERLVTREEVASDEYLGLAADPKKGFHLDLEDYLAGLILLSNEMARLCVNSVTSGDYARPIRISAFLNDLLNGFRLLNLKNDMLRKKFDSLKYDVKKVEEVVYDLSIRGLIKEGGSVKEDKEADKEADKEKEEKEKNAE